MPCAMICLRCKQRGERYSRQVARDGGLRFSSKRIRIFAAKAAEVKKRAGRCIGELIEEDRKPGGWRDKRRRPKRKNRFIHSYCRALLALYPRPMHLRCRTKNQHPT